jgi:hypothetical protein
MSKMGSNAEQFASRGDPWDDRVPLTLGLVHEPKAYKTRIHPDGFVERTAVDESQWQWDKGGSPRAAIRKGAFHEPKPSADVLEASREARRRANAAIRVHRGPLMRPR